MAKQFWLNLPVKDVKKSTDFFTKLGFKFNTHHGGSPNSACMLVGEKEMVVMLFDESTFKGFTRNGITNTGQGTEVLFSIDAQSKEEVDEIVQKALEAGGTSDHKPSEMTGWMYGSVFADLDGHRWNVLYMDMSKMPK
jgi:predicted lactoylglutathione lyase